MFDLCTIFKTLQKLFQKSNLILPDVVTAKDSAIENLKVMKDIPVPGGKEEQYLEEEDDDQGRAVRRTKTAHQFVTSRNRDSSAIRNEILQSAINFLGQRMNTENDGTIKSLMSILDATSSKDLIVASIEIWFLRFLDLVTLQILSLMFASHGPTCPRLSMLRWKTLVLLMLFA